MKTITVSIGNSDNKLTQEEWARFCKIINSKHEYFANEIYFYGLSNPDSVYQNASWISSIDEESIEDFVDELTDVRKSFRQDSIAILVGETRFI